ncbi:MAG: carbohydrate ABC transporter permease, partial [Pseudomonadota bacterium]
MSAQSEKQNPAFYALVVALVVMSVGPIALMLATSFKTNVDVYDASVPAFFFSPTIKNYETVLCNFLWYEPEHV